MSLVPGQRVISDAEIQMGLGTVLLVEQRTVTVLYLATGDTRTYAQHSAPLTRVRFAVGDSVRSHDGLEIRVQNASERRIRQVLLSRPGESGEGDAAEPPLERETAP